MITVESVLHVSGVVLFILISTSFIMYTGKFIFREDKLKKPPDLIYDPDHGDNISAVCIFSPKLYSTAYEESPCHNKTLMQWYNPWLRHGLWKGLWAELNARNRRREVKSPQMELDEKSEPEAVSESPVTHLPQKKTPQVQKTKAERVEFIYSLLIGLLIISVLFAYWEVFKDRLKKNAVAAAKTQGQECTLADFTINRHRRRESQQQQQQTAAHLPRQASYESTAKVTQTLIHQSSLDRAFPKTVSEVAKSIQVRRSSVPVSLDNDMLVSGRNQSVSAKATKRQSVDVNGEEISSDLRKKARHLIRRH